MIVMDFMEASAVPAIELVLDGLQSLLFAQPLVVQSLAQAFRVLPSF